ncbi:MAG: hypothetical protein HHJ12_19460 [Glaciimonas sp.]|nr:hypothetical protein [Glaciimonas sp.]
MTLRPLALATLVTCTLFGCSAGHNSATDTVSSTSGVVATDSALVGAVITATDKNGKTLISAATDINGNYTLSTGSLAVPFVLSTPFIDSDGQPAILSSVVNGSGNVRSNITPLTALITQRLLGATLTVAPTASQIDAAHLDSTVIAQAMNDIKATLQPAFTMLNIPVATSNDLIGSAYVADANVDALDNFLTLVRVNVHAGTVSIGTGTDNVLVNLPSTGKLDGPSVLSNASMASLKALNDGQTTTAIQNVIIVIGENHTFDSVYGAYKAPTGQTIANLLSKGIINADGTPGANFALAAQSQAIPQNVYAIDQPRSTPYANLPQPFLTGVYNPQTFQLLGNIPDPRYPANLPNGPYQITKYVPYAAATSATGDPMHRFFQMWQQTGGDNIKQDLFTWVAVNTGVGNDNSNPATSVQNPGQGGELMGFVNVNAGDAPVFNSLAQGYALSDNYHQSIMGGTGANFFSIATGDLPFYNENGVVKTPPSNQIENPNPQTGTNNFYTRDGYSGGSYVNCSDVTQPGVSAILNVLNKNGRKSNCEAGKYYLVNNYEPAYDMNGNLKKPVLASTDYIYPPQTVPTIGEALTAKKVSWKWYTGGRDAADIAQDGPLGAFQYNTIGDPHNASSNFANNATLRSSLKGLSTFYNDVANNTLPAVSFVVPKNLDSGHPGYSVTVKYELFLNDLISRVQANPTLWKKTAVIVITDEGGGSFDSGYIHNQDFFGSGPRIPMLVVSPYAKKGYVDHVYHDHGSLLKFIERNWRLKPLSSRSRDNLPNPIVLATDPYKPVNGAAIGDLMSMFKF